MANEDIKEAAKQAGVKLWEIAECLGINDGNFSRKLRMELSPADKENVLLIINTIVGAQKREQEGIGKISNWRYVFRKAVLLRQTLIRCEELATDMQNGLTKLNGFSYGFSCGIHNILCEIDEWIVDNGGKTIYSDDDVKIDGQMRL